MFKTALHLLFALAASSQAIAGPATDESLEQLLVVARVESLLVQVHANADQVIRQGIAHDVAGRTLTEEQRRALDAAPAKLGAVLRSELSWQKLRPMYLAIYKESLDQAEVDGLIAFYRTPVGQAVLDKMPAIMTRTMSVTQLQMQAVMPKIEAAMQEALKEARLAPKS